MFKFNINKKGGMPAWAWIVLSVVVVAGVVLFFALRTPSVIVVQDSGANSNSALEKEDIYVVSSGYVHSTCWDSEESLEVSALIKASNPVDVYWVPDEANVDLFINGLDFTHYPECYNPSVLQSNIVCVIDGDGCLMVSNVDGLESSSVSVLLTAD